MSNTLLATGLLCLAELLVAVNGYSSVGEVSPYVNNLLYLLVIFSVIVDAVRLARRR